MNNRKKLFLIDAYALIFRGYYAFIKNPRINSKGMDTSAIMGFMNSLLDLIKREKPDNIAVAFDLGGSSDRIELFEEYKANRHETPDAIKIAVPYIHNILKAMGIPILMKKGFEADDIIGTVAKDAEKNNFKVFMVTPDKDFAQLVSENIFMYKPSRMGNGIEIWGIKEVQQRFEVTDPIQVIDFLGMMGDSVDNIPGLPGVGEKTAKKFINLYGSMESLLENTAEIKGKLREKIELNKDKGILSKKLATIMLDVPIEYDFNDFKLEDPNHKNVYEIFEELEFARMKENFKRIFIEDKKEDDELPNQDTQQDIQYDLFSVPGQSDANLNKEKNTFLNSSKFYQINESKLSKKLTVSLLKKQKIISLEVFKFQEKENCLGISFSWDKDKSYFINLEKTDSEIYSEIKSLFEIESLIIIGFNLKYQFKLLNDLGLKIQGKYFDNKIAHYLVNPDLNHDFKTSCQTYLNYSPDLNNESKVQICMEKSDLNFQLSNLLKNDLKKGNLLKLFEDIEMPLLQVLSVMEINGIKLNSSFLKELSDYIS